MSTEMNNTANQKQGKLPLWFKVLFPLALFFTLSTIGIYAYQQQKAAPQDSVKAAQFEIKKQQLLEQEDVINTNWLHTLNPLVKNVRGRLLWSNTKQQGIMEFSNLPILAKNQQFRLWIYDLDSTDGKAIPASMAQKDTFNKKSSKNILIPFTAKTIVKNPFKFELLLEEKGVKDGQPLLLAQP